MRNLSKTKPKEVSMLRTVLCCMLVVAAAAMGWETMSSVDYPAEVQAGSAITYGDGKIWGIFPDPSDSNWTHFEYYDPDSALWFYPGINYDLDFLGDPAITFDWRFGGEVLVVGNDDGDPDFPTLFSYSLTESDWESEEIEDFSLGAGTSIAFRPASGYYGTYVAGWMYCLAGGGSEFWCYSVPGPGDQKINGICPGETSLVADQTPLFLWTSGSNQNRLQVSTSSIFLDTLIDEVLSIPEYQVAADLENGVYYWRSGVYIGGTWSWSSTHSFTLEGGWTQLADIPVDVSYGASLAYEQDFYSSAERMVALAGDDYQFLSKYDINANTWDNSTTTPKPQGVGSAIVTHEAASSTPPDWPGPWAVFGEGYDSVYYHTDDKPGWPHYFDLPQSLGAGASLAYSIESGTHYLYLIVGQDEYGDPRNDFYRQELPSYGRSGGQALSTRLTSMTARSLSGSEGITVEYQLSTSGRVIASVFDAIGRQVSMLDAGLQQPGTHRLGWTRDNEGHRLNAGTYFVLLDMGTGQAGSKAVVR
jgi:hypothetical protein